MHGCSAGPNPEHGGGSDERAVGSPLIRIQNVSRTKCLTESRRWSSWGLMEHVDPNTLANIILAAPRWAQTSLAASTYGGRQRAAEEIARVILEQVVARTADPDPDQFGLSL